jgi:thiosulfate dehydrogenase [quinone] large subunit
MMSGSRLSQSPNLDPQTLRAMPLFADMTDEALAAHSHEIEVWQFEPGAMLLHQAEPAESMYVLQSGRAEVVVAARNGQERVVAQVGPGDPVGELGLLTAAPRSASVRVVEPVVALRLSRTTFAALMADSGFATQVAGVVAGRVATTNRTLALEEPPLSRFLFSDTRMAWFWLLLRLWVGYQWVQSGILKLQNPAWMDTGTALQGYWKQAVAVSPRAAITYDWYRAFIQFLLDTGSYTWFAKLIAIGETSVGVGLIVGCLTGVAAAGGLVMNASYLLAGSASTNPVLAALELLIILAWKVAGWWGLDRLILGPILVRGGVRVRSRVRAASQPVAGAATAVAAATTGPPPKE